MTAHSKSGPIIIDGNEIAIAGTLLNMARVHGEYYVSVQKPENIIQKLKQLNTGARIFTFLQDIGDQQTHYPYYHEPESLAVLPISTYEHWWKKQINDKTRNMIRKAQKCGVELRECTFNDTFIQGIMEIYNESPLRQGKPFKHYGKDFETIKQEHATFLERSVLVGAFHGEEMIGFIKLVHGRCASSLMQIISKISWRDKAPTNALIAKAVEICSAMGIRFLHYGIWSKRSLGDFKKHHGFLQNDILRYYIPLDFTGWLGLKLHMHRNATSFIPDPIQDRLVALRSQWNQFRYQRESHFRGSGLTGRAS